MALIIGFKHGAVTMAERFIQNGWTVKAFDVDANVVFEAANLYRDDALETYWSLHDCDNSNYSKVERSAVDRWGCHYSYYIEPPQK